MRNNIDVIGIIPARYESSRLTHKLLRTVYGKPLIQWAWESASKASLLDGLIIACDDAKIKKAAESFGATAVMTSTKHQSGTDRIAEAIRDIDAKIVINIQADEPLMHHSVIDSLAREMLNNPTTLMATVKKKIETEEDANNPNIVKLISDKNGFAIYFSRYPIPYYRDSAEEKKHYKHLGIYAYTKDFLYTFKNLPASYLEKAERLEQLRAIEAGYKIKTIETRLESIGVDTEEDLIKVEAAFKTRADKGDK